MKERSSAVASPPALPARPWAICLGKADLSAAGRLRQVAGIEVCERTGSGLAPRPRAG